MRRPALLAAALLVVLIAPLTAAASVTGTWRRIQAPTLELHAITDNSIPIDVAGSSVVFTGNVSGTFLLTAPSPSCDQPLRYDARVLPGETVINGTLLDSCVGGSGITFAGQTHVSFERCTCYDGNALDGDGCDATCQIEPCWTCTGAPSVCTPLAEGAACDDRRDCTADTVCTAGSCGGGGVSPACIDMTGRWSVSSVNTVPPFLSGFIDRVVQRNGIVRFLGDYDWAPLRAIGTIDSTTGAFLAWGSYDYAPCVGKASERAGTADADSYSGDISYPGWDPRFGNGCTVHSGRLTATRICAGSPNGAACDDGNPCTSGDVCVASNCVGSAVPDGTACDDGNVCTTSDTCDAGSCSGLPRACAACSTCDPYVGCTMSPNGSSCDDGKSCTLDDRCDVGVCTGATDCDVCQDCDAVLGCVVRPRMDCERTLGGKTSMTVRRLPTGASPSLTWKWKGGDGVTMADLGNPNAGVELCLFDESTPSAQLLFATRASGGLCEGVPCWKPLGAKGYRYRSRVADGGVAALSMKAGVAGKASVALSGKGDGLVFGPHAMPAPPFPLPLRAQLQTDAMCFEAAIGIVWTSKNSDGVFKSKAP